MSKTMTVLGNTSDVNLIDEVIKSFMLSKFDTLVVSDIINNNIYSEWALSACSEGLTINRDGCDAVIRKDFISYECWIVLPCSDANLYGYVYTHECAENYIEQIKKKERVLDYTYDKEKDQYVVHLIKKVTKNERI